MAIVKMKRLHMLALESDRDELFDKLQHLGCLEVAEQSDRLSDPEWAELVHLDESMLELEQLRLETITKALSLLDQHAPTKKKLLSAKPQIKEAALFDDEALQQALKVAEKIILCSRQLDNATDELQKMSSEIKALMPWAELDVPLDSHPTGALYTAFGMIPARTNLDAVEEDLSREAEASKLYLASTDADMHYIFFLCHMNFSQTALNVLKDYGFSFASFNHMHGTAAENIQAIIPQISALEESCSKLRLTLASLSDTRDVIQLAYDRISQEIQKETCKRRLLSTGKVFFLDGWSPEASIPKLEPLFISHGCAYEFSDPSEEEYPIVPVSLKNNNVIASLNAVTNMYSLPAYGSLDPNPLMAPFFILYFGMMMADMAYGLLMFFGCMFFIKKTRPKGGTLHLFSLIQYCGITAFIFGALTGGFFGDLIPQLVNMTTGKVISLPHLFTPIDDAVAVLIGSLVLGLTQILTGMGINMYKLIKRGELMAALCGEGAWFLVFILIGVAFLSGAVVPCVIAIIAVLVLTQGYGKKGIGGKLAGIGGSLYNKITGYFSDILSYSRLMALMLSGAVIAQVFNTLGTLTGNVLFFFVIAMVGNALNFALNLLSCYVHDLRLQCLEFFGYFYEDGGKAFDPVSVNTKYVDIIQ